MAAYNKTIVSVIMGILLILQRVFGWHVAWLTEDYITMLIAVVWPILVWLVPNAEAR